MKTKNKFIIITLLLMATCSFLFNAFTSQTAAKDKNAQISFTETTYDFGKVEEGTELEHIFKFTNNGEEKLVIYSINASCGCTGVQTGDKKEFSHGETGEIKVLFSTSGRKGFQNKSVTVKSNDPVSSQVILAFKCEIISKQSK